MNGNCEPTSVADLTNAPVDERQQIPAARFVNLEQSPKPDEWRLEQQMNAPGFGMMCSPPIRYV